jgi:mevalonate kinase
MEHANLSNRSYPGKLLLIGEYSVIDGSGALVIPWRNSTANLDFMDKQRGNEDLDSNRGLFNFASWLKENRNPELPVMEIPRLLNDIDRGLYFRSSIPAGYGMGSSGALCAALYDVYAEQKAGLSEPLDSRQILAVKKSLAAMESWFHGTSSGIDPLCIYLNKPLVIKGKEDILPWNMENDPEIHVQAFLLNTGIPGNTGELVNAFRQKLSGQSLLESFTAQYIPLVNELVEQFVEGRPDYDSLVQLSLFQWRIFQDMIPESVRNVWQYGLDWEYYTFKLLGSGGGGYILGFTQDYEYARHSLRERFNLEPVKVKIW